jgi:DNA polymerase-3 subunit gamma/tau
MRDSQSLLEQVMSFSSGKITVDQVHALLGTADESRLRELAEALANRDGVSALKLVDKAIAEGTDAGQFAEQMLGYLRDLMAVAVGGGPDLLKMCNPSGFEQVKALADRWGLQTILAAVQLLDESLVRMRFSVQSQALFELSLIQISQLQDLASIARIIEAASQGTPLASGAPPRGPATAAPGEKKNVEGLNRTPVSRAIPAAAAPAEQISAAGNAPTSPPAAATITAPAHSVSAAPTIAITAPPTASAAAVGGVAPAKPASSLPGQTPQAQAALETWKAAAATIDGMLGDFAGLAVAVECRTPDQWTVVFPAGSTKSVEYIDVPARREEIQNALDTVAGRSLQFSFRVLSGPVERKAVEPSVSPAVARSQRLRQLAEHPYVSRLCELMQGEIVRVDAPQASPAGPAPSGSSQPGSTQSGASPPAPAQPPAARQQVSTADAH